MGAQADLTLMAARRSFATAQGLLAGGPVSGLPARLLEVGWHDSSVDAEDGSCAVVQTGAGLDDLVGEVVGVTFGGVTVYAYVLTTADVPVVVSVTRRVFAALYRLTPASLLASVAVVDA